MSHRRTAKIKAKNRPRGQNNKPKLPENNEEDKPGRGSKEQRKRGNPAEPPHSENEGESDGRNTVMSTESLAAQQFRQQEGDPSAHLGEKKKEKKKEEQMQFGCRVARALKAQREISPSLKPSCPPARRTPPTSSRGGSAYLLNGDLLITLPKDITIRVHGRTRSARLSPDPHRMQLLQQVLL